MTCAHMMCLQSPPFLPCRSRPHARNQINTYAHIRQLVGQQEYVMPTHTGKFHIFKDEERSRVKNLAREQLNVDSAGANAQKWKPHELAVWERQIKLRHNATKVCDHACMHDMYVDSRTGHSHTQQNVQMRFMWQAESFKARLQQRAQRFKHDTFESGKPPYKACDWGSCSRPPLRRETVRILTSACYVYVCMFVCMYMHVCVCVCTYTYDIILYICVCVCEQVHMSVCMPMSICSAWPALMESILKGYIQTYTRKHTHHAYSRINTYSLSFADTHMRQRTKPSLSDLQISAYIYIYIYIIHI